jgi:ring-1,2-phenylacetyl-CoA epoxidase subunit PaaD
VSDAAGSARVWTVLEKVMDPELPMLSLIDLGVIRSVETLAGGTVRVGVSPTYSGCPAQQVIRQDIMSALHGAGFAQVRVHDELSPPWTSDWISARGRERLRECGIAPPEAGSRTRGELRGRAPEVACPHCGSTRTERVSEFGSTPCKAHYRCAACLEPFEYFKCI